MHWLIKAKGDVKRCVQAPRTAKVNVTKWGKYVQGLCVLLYEEICKVRYSCRGEAWRVDCECKVGVAVHAAVPAQKNRPGLARAGVRDPALCSTARPAIIATWCFPWTVSHL